MVDRHNVQKRLRVLELETSAKQFQPISMMDVQW